MKNNIGIGILSVLLIGGFLWFYIANADFTPPSEREDRIFKERISKLEAKIDSLRDQKDSIRTVIDSTHVKIITNEKHYQEVVNTIISQPTSSDYMFISNYIRLHRSQRDSTNIRGASETQR